MRKRVAIVACSNALAPESREKIEKLKQLLKKLQMDAICSEYLYTKEDGNSASGKVRAEVLMNYYEDPEISEIFDVSGGDIANEILSYLDYELIANVQKRFWGYSDLTTIINAIYTKTGKKSVLYQVRFLKEESTKELFQIQYEFLQGKEMQGVLVGGNIRCLLKLAGTEYWPDMTGKILLLEARSGKVPQMITFLSQLKQLGVFNKVSGVILGTFTEMEREGCKPNIEELVKQFAGDELPIAKTYDIGHGQDAKAILIGEEYNFKAKER